MKLFFSIACVAACLSQSFADDGAKLMKKYAYSWNCPSIRESDSMPIGNGDLAANVYTDGNALYLLLAKADNYDGAGNILKIGRIKISTVPNFFAGKKNFRQTLDIENGKIDLFCDGASFKIWTDFNKPVWRVEANLPQSARICVEPVFWKRDNSSKNADLQNSHKSARKRFPQHWEVGESSTEDISADTQTALQWWRKNTKSAFEENLSLFRIANKIRLADPLSGFVSATRAEADGLKNSGGKLCGNAQKFSVKISTVKGKGDSPSEAFEKLSGILAAVDSNDWQRHIQSLNSFWNRSWICVSDNTVKKSEREKQSENLPYDASERTETDGGFIVAQHYNIERFMMMCQSRGKCQTPFNGGLFSTPISYSGKTFSEDTREWGRGFTFQNQRLLYWPMFHAGDEDLIRPFFNHYLNLLPIRKAITKMWFGHEGAFFREYMPLAGDDIGDRNQWKWKFDNVKKIYVIADNGGARTPLKMPAVVANGRQKARASEEIPAMLLPSKVKIGDVSKCGYHNFHTNSGLEIAQMMLTFYAFTNDENFFENEALPFAKEVLKFYELHFPREKDGRLWLEPTQAVETFWYTKNGTPDVAGLTAVLRGLLKYHKLSDFDRNYFYTLLKKTPAIPLGNDAFGGQIILPAEKILTGRHNSECPELYAAFPYELYGTAVGGADIVKNTMPLRSCKDALGNRCWAQDEIFFAYAGMANEAAKRLEKRFRAKSVNMRFPMFAREIPDHVPDFDHNGSGSVALQKMLIQEGENKIVLLPAWPAKWDCNFKLRVSKNGTVCGKVENGILKDWTITPQTLAAKVEIRAPQPAN